MKVAIYPGSFDPITNGHLDIIERSSKIFDKLIVSVLHNSAKNAVFSVEEKINLIKKATLSIPNVEIDYFDGLLVDYAKKKSATTIIKGLRAVSDFEYEMQMALMNRKQNPDVETMFLIASSEYSFLSSSIVKEVARLGGNLDGFVPECIKTEIYNKFTI